MGWGRGHKLRNWFAWTARMNGRWLLLLATVVFLGSLTAPWLPIQADMCSFLRSAGPRTCAS